MDRRLIYGDWQNGYLDFVCSLDRYIVRIYWAETYDAATNTSGLSFSPTFWSTIAPYVNAYPDFTVYVNGTTVIRTESWSGRFAVPYMSQSYMPYEIQHDNAVIWESITLPHNDDGSLTVTVSIGAFSYSSGMMTLSDGTTMTVGARRVSQLRRFRARPKSPSTRHPRLLARLR